MNYILNIIGLAFDMAGVILLFIYGLPSKVEQHGGGILLEESINDRSIREKSNKKIERMANFALFLIFIGFLFQVIVNATSYVNSNQNTPKKPKTEQ